LTATVLFTDLQNFTTVFEQMEPHALMEWLNQYMATMVNIIENQYHGQVNKFIGDGIMAVFGVPIPRTSPEAIAHDAINAVNCAVTMRREMSRLTEQWQAQELPLIRMRVGIFTGTVIVGSLGSVERQEYAVLGDTVNIASRLESFDKNIESDNLCRILIGESTLELIRGYPFKTKPVGEVNLKGKQSRITLYRVTT
jgi:adenylate cyclase